MFAGAQSDTLRAPNGMSSPRSAHHRLASISVCLSTVKGKRPMPVTCGASALDLGQGDVYMFRLCGTIALLNVAYVRVKT